MPKRIASPFRADEPDLLKRLRKAVGSTGLTADIAPKNAAMQAILVTGRIAQAALYRLHALSPEAEGRLLEELQALAGPEETALLVQGRGYTFFHVVQFLYEYAGHHAALSDPCTFSLGVGRSGGGLDIKPETDIVSLIRLLIAGLPPRDDRRNIGLLVRALSPLMLDKVFVTGDFRIAVSPEGEDRLGIALRYTNRRRAETWLEALGLGGDAGRFFLNTAGQIQGTIQLGLRTFTQNVGRYTTMEGLVERRDPEERKEVERSCTCGWTVAWRPDIRLRRLADPEKILTQVRTIYETLHRRDLEYFQERTKTLEMRVRALEGGDQFHELIGASPRMRRVYRLIRQVAASDLTVLVRGESGTGKELVARAIHDSSARRERPFIAVNCAALSENLLESELFGHERGAFTGADRMKPGRFELAEGGTLFLDEIGDIPATTQVKLLRVLETKAFERVGGTRTIRVDVRVVGATHRNLEELIAREAFREDFYFRLNVLPLDLPPLREHPEDIPLLAQAFLMRIAMRAERPLRGLSQAAVRRLQSHPWPGNIRELRNVVDRAAVYAHGTTLTEADVAQALGPRAQPGTLPSLSVRQQQILEAIRAAEAGSTVEDLLPLVAGSGPGGQSRRTLQNDLRRLSGIGHVTYRKQGSARRYLAAPQ